MRIIALTIVLTLAGALSTRAQDRAATAEPSKQQVAIEKQIAVQPDVTVSICVTSGDVTVHGWEKNEVRVVSRDPGRIAFNEAKTGKTLEVLVSNIREEDSTGRPSPCETTSDIDVYTPRTSTVRIKAQEGDVDVADVAAIHVESLSGDVDARGISKETDISCLSGDVSLTDSKGRARLRSVSGDVDATNLTPEAAADEVVISSTSGEVMLDRVSHAVVKGSAISGNVRMTGALVRQGNYELTTTSGDVTLELPADASFKVNARVVFSGEIITDFPVTTVMTVTRTVNGTAPMPPQPPDPGGGAGRPPRPPRHTAPPAHRDTQTVLAGVVGSGGPELKLTSFSGTVYLKKK